MGRTVQATLLLAALSLGALACSGKRTPKSGDTGASSACEALRPKLTKLYSTEKYDAPEGEAGVKLREDLVASNVHMVLTDCATDSDRFIPCLERASTIATIESECVVPLDDEGNAEAALFDR